MAATSASQQPETKRQRRQRQLKLGPELDRESTLGRVLAKLSIIHGQKLFELERELEEKLITKGVRVVNCDISGRAVSWDGWRARRHAQAALARVLMKLSVMETVYLRRLEDDIDNELEAARHYPDTFDFYGAVLDRLTA